jgi:deazaflavin-dependent oxidoreductase (nitroreductase family)
MSDWNTQVIEQFREGGGKVGGDFEGMPLLLLHHVGAKSGTERVTPLVYQQVGDAYAVFASKGGAPTNPDWHHNLLATPDTKIEIGTETLDVTARVADDDERSRIWETQKERYPNFAEYERTAGDRVIPVVVLEPRS